MTRPELGRYLPTPHLAEQQGSEPARAPLGDAHPGGAEFAELLDLASALAAALVDAVEAPEHNQLEASRGVSPGPFSVVGVLASLTEPLAEAGVGIFVVSTFDTGYLLVKEVDLAKAIAALRQRGHMI
jgi:uncharacterized protein